MNVRSTCGPEPELLCSQVAVAITCRRCCEAVKCTMLRVSHSIPGEYGICLVGGGGGVRWRLTGPKIGSLPKKLSVPVKIDWLHLLFISILRNKHATDHAVPVIRPTGMGPITVYGNSPTQSADRSQGNGGSSVHPVSQNREEREEQKMRPVN